MIGSGLTDLIDSAFAGVEASWLTGKKGCVRCAHSGRCLKLSCNHSCRPVSRRGMRSASTLKRHVCIIQAVTGWTTSSPRLCSFTSCCAPKGRGLAPSTALHSTSPPVLFHRCPPQLCKIPLMALSRNGYGIACHGEGWLTTLWRICLQTQGGQLECSVGRPAVRGADRNKDWNRWTERHHVIPGTIGGMDRLIAHISIRIIMHSTIATLQFKQTALARRHTKKKVSRDARLILMIVDASAMNSINVLIPWRSRAMFLCNIVNGQVALKSDALVLGALMVTAFRKSLPAGFHAKLSSPVKTMKKLKHLI